MRITKTLFTLFIMLFVFSGLAYAGIWDKFTDIAVDKIATVVVSGIFVLLSAFLGKKVLKYKAMANEAMDFMKWLYDSTRPGSPGGAKITGKELEDGLKEAGEFGVAVLAAIGKRDNS